MTLSSLTRNLINVNRTVLREQAGAPATWPDAGQIYTLAADNLLYYIDSLGVPIALGAGGGVSTFDATVGAAGADYTTVVLAIAGGAKRILLVDDVTETQDVIFPAGDFLVYIPYEFTWDMGVWSWESSAATYLTLLGERSQQEDGSVIAWAHTGSPLIHATDFLANSSIHADGITWDNTSPNDNSGVTSWNAGQTISWYINNCLFNIPNKVKCGLRILPPAALSSFLNNSVFIGAGANADYVLRIDGTPQFASSNVEFRGTFDNVNTFVIGAAFTATIDNWTMNLGGNAAFNVTGNNISIHTVKVINAGALTLNWSGDRGYLVDAWLNGGTFNPTGDDMMAAQVFAGAFTPGGGGRQSYTNMDVTAAVTLDVDDSFYDGCRFLAGASVDADDVGLVNCQAGPIGGGGASNINTAVGANRTRIAGCMTDAAIVDLGAGTVVAANTVF
jgi:hypothetical protein